jgi:hypothetical protein
LTFYYYYFSSTKESEAEEEGHPTLSYAVREGEEDLTAEEVKRRRELEYEEEDVGVVEKVTHNNSLLFCISGAEHAIC